MKILYMSNMFPNFKSNAGIFIVQRLRELLENNVEVECLLLNSILNKEYLIRFAYDYNFKSPDLEKDIIIKAKNFLKIPKTNIYINILNKLKNIFFSEGCHLIHHHFVFEAYISFLLKKKYRIPYVVTAHGSDIHTDPFKDARLKKMAVNILEFADRAIFVSNFLLTKAKELGYSGKNSIVIPNGINEKQFRIMKNNQTKIANDRVVGFVGSFVPIKRSAFLPEIFYIISKRIKNVKFLLVGDGDLNNLIIRKLKKFGIWQKSIMTGEIPYYEVPFYMNSMDILVLPSLNEGWPCVVLEAQACGIPVVGSSKGGIPEAIGSGGVTVKEGDDFIERFADEVIRLLESKPEKRKLQKRALEFTWSNIVAKEIEIYHQIIEEKYSDNVF